MARRKLLIRCFFVSLVILLIVDVFPMQAWLLRIKRPVALIMDVLGLRQGSWAMFTPNPVINNRWITAEIETKDGRKLKWDSPFWSRANTWDKFVQFRHVNYYNRVFQPWCKVARQDLLDYIARSTGEDVQSIQLHLVRMDLIMPEDGSLPVREEAEWRIISEPWIGKGQEQ